MFHSVKKVFHSVLNFKIQTHKHCETPLNTVKLCVIIRAKGEGLKTNTQNPKPYN